MLRLLTGLLGVLVVLGTTSSVVRTLIVPRAVRSKLTRAVTAATLAPFNLVADRSTSVEVRDRLRAWGGPLSLVTTLIAWLLFYLLGYGLLVGATSVLAPAAALREAGSSLFTLGFASTDRSALTVVDFIAAATGPLAIGLLVGYLPTLYAAYNRREVEVALLEARAGEPAWGPEILARQAQVATLSRLDELFASWERWAADVAESHTNYPVLILVRSPLPYRSWLVALLAVMDAAALQLACNPSQPQTTARLTLRMGFSCLRSIAATERVPFDSDPDPEGELVLTYQEFLGGITRMADRGYAMERGPEEAWPHFRGWRVNYEQIAHRLAYDIDAVPAMWSGPRRGGLAPIPVRSPQNRQPGRGTAPPRAVG